MDALESLYNATAGAQWRFNRNWMHGDPCLDSWLGVRCAVTQGSRVVLGVESLALDAARLSGTLPSALGLLTGLTALSIALNPALRGSLPSELGRCSLLRTAKLFSNALQVGQSVCSTPVTHPDGPTHLTAHHFAHFNNCCGRIHCQVSWAS